MFQAKDAGPSPFLKAAADPKVEEFYVTLPGRLPLRHWGFARPIPLPHGAFHPQTFSWGTINQGVFFPWGHGFLDALDAPNLQVLDCRRLVPLMGMLWAALSLPFVPCSTP